VLFTTALGREVVPILSPAPIVMESEAAAVWAAGAVASATWALKVKVPAVVGVPEMLPFDARLSPAGSEPDAIVHV
jgi:hypothetical protein